MAENANKTLTIFKPGSKGFLEQEIVGDDAPTFDTASENMMFSADGTLRPRPMFANTGSFVSNSAFMASDVVDFFIAPAIRYNQIFCYTPTQIFMDDGAGQYIDLTDKEAVPGDMGTWLNGWWQAVSMKDKVFFFQEDMAPRIYDKQSDTSYELTATCPPVGIAHYAFGRLWSMTIRPASSGTPYANTLHWSTLLNGEDWSGAGSGSLDLSPYLQLEECCTGINDFNRLLVVFTNKKIILFKNPFNVPVDTGGTGGTPEVMELKETIDGIGCIGRKLHKKTGNDLVFAARIGLMSLGRVLSDGGSNPLSTLSVNVANKWQGFANVAELSYFLPQYNGSDLYSEPTMSWLPFSGIIFVNNGWYNAAGGFDSTYDGHGTSFLFHMNEMIDKGVPAVTKWQCNNQGSAILGGIAEHTKMDIYGGASAIFRALICTNPVNGVSYKGLAEAMRVLIVGPSVEQFTAKIKTPNLFFGEARDAKKVFKRLLLTFAPPMHSGPAPQVTPVTIRQSTDFGQDEYLFTFDAQPTTSYVRNRVTKSIPLKGDGFAVDYSIEINCTQRTDVNMRFYVLALQATIGRTDQGI